MPSTDGRLGSRTGKNLQKHPKSVGLQTVADVMCKSRRTESEGMTNTFSHLLYIIDKVSSFTEYAVWTPKHPNKTLPDWRDMYNMQ